jgi:hypothetical protein
MNTLAAAALAFALPLAALAQTAPPSPPLDYAPQVVQVAPASAPTVIVEEVEPEGALDLSKYPSRQRDEVWNRYARRNQVSVNLLYPVGGAILLGVATGFWGSLGSSDALGAVSLPVEYERSMNRNCSLFGVIQPTVATGLGSTELSVAVGAGTRLYLSGNAPQGFWTGLQVDHALGSHAFTTRAEIGSNTIFENGLTFSIGAGLGLTYASDVINPITGLNIPFFPAAGLRVSLGYAFI